MRRTPKAERGSSMVEFAIAASLMLLVLFGIVDYARLFYTEHAVNFAARAASRWAVVHGKDSASPADAAAVQDYVRGMNTPLLTSTSITVTTAWPGNATCTVTAAPKNARGCLVSVHVTYPYTFLMLSSSQKTVSSTSKMIISQ